MSGVDDELAEWLRKARALTAEQRAKLSTEDLLRLSLRVIEEYHAEMLYKLACPDK